MGVPLRVVGAGRFAPSPTADLHVGNLRTALLAWAFARADNLAFLIRVEDLDQQRVAAAPEVASRQLQDLARLGLEWDQPVVRQSERLELYRSALQHLEVYECFCSRREVAAASQAPHDPVRRYPGTCSRLNSAQRAQRRRLRVPAWRVRASGAVASAWDLHAGTVTGVVDDFVVQRGDGTPAYHLAVVVDDGEQGVTQVTRGVDLLESSPRHVWLASQLGYDAPVYRHVGLAINEKGQRLSKRDGAVTLRTLAERGVSPEAVLQRLGASMGLAELHGATDLLNYAHDAWDSLDPWSDWTLPPGGWPPDH